MTDPTPEDVERVAIALFLQNPNRNQALNWDHAATPKARYRNAAKAALAAMPDHSALIRELRDALETIKRRAFYHMVQHADERGDRKVLGEIKELAIAACRKANEALGEKA